MAETTSLKFPNMFDVARNQVAVLSDDAAIVNRTKLLILSEPKSLYNEPNFGVGLAKYMWHYNVTDRSHIANQRAIIEDNTDYRDEDGNKLNISNRFEKLKFKVKKDIDVPLNAIINPINVTGKVTGEYRNNLSLKCDDIQVISQQPRKV